VGLVLAPFADSIAADSAGSVQEPASQESPSTDTTSIVHGDVGIFSQYAERGLTYSHEQPVPQGRIEIGKEHGPYLGIWGSRVSHFDFGNEFVELDPYGGYKLERSGIKIDVGLWSWIYPSGRTPISGSNYNSLESYLGVEFSNVEVIVWYDLRDYFGLNARSAMSDFGVSSSLSGLVV
jgi:uncharacterized protein (TIGR02001 family)